MKCFIASAFDREDVDLIYDRAIRPGMKKGTGMNGTNGRRKGIALAEL
jgi:hypothetical protein